MIEIVTLPAPRHARLALLLAGAAALSVLMVLPYALTLACMSVSVERAREERLEPFGTIRTPKKADVIRTSADVCI